MTRAAVETKLLAEMADIRRRLDDIERAKWRETHLHVWEYKKFMIGSNGAPQFEWACVDAERCLGRGGWTVESDQLPEHFPAELR